MAVGVGTSLFADLGNLGTRRSSRFYCTSRCLLQESTLQSGLHVPSDQERLLELQSTPPNPDECEQAMLKHGIRAVPATSLFTLKYYLHTNYGKTGFSSAPKKWNLLIIHDLAGCCNGRGRRQAKQPCGGSKQEVFSHNELLASSTACRLLYIVGIS